MSHPLTLYHTIWTFNNPEKKSLLKTVGRGQMLVTRIFSLSHNVFYHSKKNLFLNYGTSDLSSADTSNLDQSQFFSFRKAFRVGLVHLERYGWGHTFLETFSFCKFSASSRTIFP